MLDIEQLTAAYGEKTVLLDVSLDVSAGEVLGLIGPNGAGKSTLIRAATGVIKIRGGRITYKGIDLIHLPSLERARILAVVPQARQLGGAFTVEQTVCWGAPRISACWVKPARRITAWRSGPWSRPLPVTWHTGMWPSFPAVSSSASCWPGRWRKLPRYCCWMSPPTILIYTTRLNSYGWCAGWQIRKGWR